jgi:hypothetical protein
VSESPSPSSTAVGGPAVLGLSTTSGAQPITTPLALGLSILLSLLGFAVLRKNA